MMEILLAPNNMFMLGAATAFFMSAWISAPVKVRKPTAIDEDATECARD